MKVPGGSRWKLREDAKPMKHNFSMPGMKRKPPLFRCEKLKPKPPLFRCEKLKPKRLRFGEKNECSPVCLRQPKSLFETSLLVVKASTSTIRRENIRLKTELEKTKEELEATKDKMRKTTFSVDIIRNNDKLCKHYTGFPNFDRFRICYEFLRAGGNGENVIMKDASGGKTRPGARALCCEDQFFLVLLKLRTGYSNIHCGWLFNCDESTVSRLVCSWINFMFLQFGSLPIWPSREEIDQSMPESFKQTFPKTRAIIDCTEVFVEAPESLHLRSSFYSDYKHHNTYKALVAITPAGSLSFVSELFPGSVSDKEIVSRCGILNSKFWDKDDEVMADKGFAIRDLLDPFGVKLNIPFFLEDQMQFSPMQVCINQRIASQRIHVERYIGRVKNFGIFDKPIPISMHGSANQIFTICSFLVMFQDPIISAP